MISKLRESSTFVLVVISLAIMNAMWISGRVESTLTEYGMATAAILAIWLGREWRATHYAKNN